MTRASNGFTLIEVLVVVLILSILAGIVGIGVLRHPGEAKVTAARLQLQTFRSALQLYRMEQDGYPTQEQGIEALCVQPTRPPVPSRYPDDGYLDSRRAPRDPWGRAYIYLAPGRSNVPYEVISYGRDGEPGGDGDAADLSTSDL